MLAFFTPALNSSCQDPVSLCCTARNHSCCQKILKAWEYETQGKDFTAGSWAQISPSFGFIIMLNQTGLSWGGWDSAKLWDKLHVSLKKLAVGKFGGISTCSWEQHVWAAAREQMWFLYPCRRHTNVSVIFSGWELHHTSTLQCLIGWKSEDLQAVPGTFAPSPTPQATLLP